jgi:hypothetical protein
MSALAAMNESQLTSHLLPEIVKKCASESYTPEAFTDIYRDDTNIAIWQRKLSDELASAVDEILNTGVRLKIAEAVTVKSVNATLFNALGETSAVRKLSEDITLLVDRSKLGAGNQGKSDEQSGLLMIFVNSVRVMLPCSKVSFGIIMKVRV